MGGIIGRDRLWAALIVVALLLSGCAKVGPDFVRPEATVSPNWLEVADKRVNNGPVNYRNWWQVFNDPVLDRLIDQAYRQNLDLRTAGVRVLEARAQLGIAAGELYPQIQQASGFVQYNRISEHSPQAGLFQSSTSTSAPATAPSKDKDHLTPVPMGQTRDSPPKPPSTASTAKPPSNPLLGYWQSQIGLTASWELDFWGKFRRAIESADAGLFATIADYDNTLVTLTGDVANSYILIRTLEKRLRIARQNAEAQREGLRIAEARFEYGTNSELDVNQAKTVLNNTLASIPALEARLRQAQDTLSVLLGLPPSLLTDELAGASEIPEPPPRVAIGIPVDLLRRRPDIRSAEYQAAAQCAQIGVARAELFPAFSLTGSFGYLSSDVGKFKLSDMFDWRSRTIQAGPSVQWNILNYGQITNNVRVQDARFQELLIAYQNTVLKAQREVEDALVAFLKAQERAELLAESASAAQRAVDIALLQYREGIQDYTTVLTAQLTLLSVQDNLANTLGDISANLVGVYRSLGGGWEIREGKDLVPPEVKEAMAKRTHWGRLLSPATYLPPDSEARKPVRLPDW